MSDKLRAAAQAALETLEDVFGKDKIDVGAINNLRAALAEPDIKESLTTQRPWVGLTGDEIEDINKDQTLWEIIRAAEAKLREKNT